MKRIGKMNEAAWLLGIIICSLGVCLSTKADFGLSMIASVPYIIHLKMVQIFPWYTQGTSEYIWQAILLILMCIVIRRFKARYLLSFAAAFLNGKFIDLWLFILGGNQPFESMYLRIAAFIFGTVFTAMAVAFYFRTSLPLQVYELLVKEISDRFSFNINRTKQAADIVFLILSIMLAYFLNGNFRGIGIGTVIITCTNATLISFFGSIEDYLFKFDMRFGLLEKYFPEEKK